MRTNGGFMAKGARGPAHPRWTGDDASNDAVHKRLNRERGKASGYLCSCGECADEWSYNGDDPHEKNDPRGPYSLDPAYYEPRCHGCHRARDVTLGEGNPNAKLSDADVIAIRAAVTAGQLQRVVAAQFGVTQSHVSRIVRGESRQ